MAECYAQTGRISFRFGRVRRSRRPYDSTHYRVGEVQMVDEEYVGYLFHRLVASVRLVLRKSVCLE
jgi:hypothetical protein